MLKRLSNGGTDVYEVLSYPLTDVNTIAATLNKLPMNSVIWQHTSTLHIAAMKMKRGSAFDYSRTFYELINQGIDTPQKFEEYAKNAKNIDSLSKSSFTHASRNKLKSFIVADTSVKNESKYISGQLSNATVDRTHLIPFTAIGIENNPGLLIDYDSWLNRNPMLEFEKRALKLNGIYDLIWITSVYSGRKGLNWKYLIYDSQTGHLLKKAHWIDDRWKYFWYCTKAQENIPEKGKS